MLEVVFVILSLLGAVGGIIWCRDRLRETFSDRAFSILIGKANESKVIVVCPTQPDAGSSINTPTTYEDSFAQAEIQTQLSRRGRRHEAKLHSQIEASELLDNLFLICGPVGNSITRKLFEHVEVPFLFVKRENNWSIADRTGTPQYKESENADEDFAIVGVMPNPWARSRPPTRVFLVAGLRELGTWGAAVHLTSHSRDLERRVRAERISGKGPWFAAVVRVRRDGPRPPITKVLEIESYIAHVRA